MHCFRSPLPKCHIRHLMLALCTLCLTAMFANSTLLNFTIICMRPAAADEADSHEQLPPKMSATSAPPRDKSTVGCSPCPSALALLPPPPPHHQQRQLFTDWQHSALFSATAIGCLLGTLPVHHLIYRFSLRFTLTGYGLVSALSTLAIPLAAPFGFAALFLARIIQGTSYPAQYVALGAITRKWASLESTGTFLMLISTHFQLGPMYSMPAAAYFCESSYGWPAIYYIQALGTLALFALFFACFRDSPAEHPWVDDNELKQIERDKENNDNNSPSPSSSSATAEGLSSREEHKEDTIPYRSIFSDWAVWLLIFVIFTDELGYETYTQMGPYYLNKVLGIGVTATGLFASLNYAVSLASKILSGPINDRLLAGTSDHFRIKLFAGLSQYGMAVALAALAFLPLFTHSLWLLTPFYVSLNTFTGFDFLGITRCCQTMGLRHSDLLMAVHSLVSGLVALVFPILVKLMTPNDSLEEWRNVLMFISLTMFLAMTGFMILARSSPREWAKLSKTKTSNDERIDSLTEMNGNDK